MCAAVSTGVGGTSRLLGLVHREAHEEHTAARAEGLLEQRVVRVEGQVTHEDAARAARLRGGGRGRWIAIAPASRAWVVAPLLTWARARARARAGARARLEVGPGLGFGPRCSPDRAAWEADC